MKNLTRIIVVSLALLNGTALGQQINEYTFQTVDNYPYQRLIDLSDKVEIHYEDYGEKGFKCRASIYDSGVALTTGSLQVERDNFVRDALKACLVRSEAKQILSLLFNGSFSDHVLNAKK